MKRMSVRAALVFLAECVATVLFLILVTAFVTAAVLQLRG